MTDPKEKPKDDVPDRFILEDVSGLKIDRSQGEGDPLDMSFDDDDVESDAA